MDELLQPIAHPFDVVVVPDFSGPAARSFEVQVLFFLASWLEFGGRSRQLPLHITGIGEAPESVRILAAQCGAEITDHEPLLFGGFANKLRGFEARRKTDHILLLDSDVLVFSDIHSLASTLGENTISAAATNGPCPLRGKPWREIHQALGLPFPDHQVVPLNVELDTFQRAHYRIGDGFPPYYNGGVVYAPWQAGLGDQWREHLERIQHLEPYITGAGNKLSNQPSLATAIHALQLKGYRFRLLPDIYNVRWQHISAGTVTSHQAKLLHTVGFGREHLSAYRNRAEREVDTYLVETLKLTRKLRSHRDPLTRIKHWRKRKPQIEDCRRVRDRMRLLYEKYFRNLYP